ncbi:MAG: hypothetical protein Q9220_003671 [cf. Caloplaca sp. 1 TL-2023]
MDSVDRAFPWHLGVFDAHCHPTDTVTSWDDIPGMKTRALTIMATRGQDQDLVRQFALGYGVAPERLKDLWHQDNGNSPSQIVPSFGWHPWFSHQVFDDLDPAHGDHEQPDQIAHYRAVLTPVPDDEFLRTLPMPRPLSGLLNTIRSDLERFPYALVGEIGIDRSFRLPTQWTHYEADGRDAGLTPGGREGRRLSHYRVQLSHQRKILKAQLNLAGEQNRAVSVHGVAAHGAVFETLKETWRGFEKLSSSKREHKRKPDRALEPIESTVEGRTSPARRPKPYPSRICLHSYSGPQDTLKQYLSSSIPAEIYFSFSCLVNFSNRSYKAVDVVKAVPDDRILIESDLHSAGDEMDQLLEDVARKVCAIKGWDLVAGIQQLAQNWRNFVFGVGHPEGDIRKD